jgi:DNA-binding SARP family transcriptional activator
VRYQLLGSLQVAHDGRWIDPGTPKQRAVLAALLLAAGGVMSVDRLIDSVWGDDVPGSATASLQAYSSNLRKALRPEGGEPWPIVRQAPGYYLAVADGASVDLVEFTAHCAEARDAVAAGHWAPALTAADAAPVLSRGRLLEDLADHDWVAAEAVRVDELHTECLEHRVTALLAVGRVQGALADATALRAGTVTGSRMLSAHAGVVPGRSGSLVLQL